VASGIARRSLAFSWPMANVATFWHGLELRHLTTLEAIAREGSFSAAAEALGYTQSAISGQVSQLEATVGAQLFRRLQGRRGVELTAEGAALLEHVQAIFGRLRAARADVEAIRLGVGSRSLMTIGTFPSLSTTFLPDVLARLETAPCPVRVEVREDACGSSVMAAVERGELDVAFTTLPLPEGPYRAVELFRDPYYLVVSEHHPLAGEEGPVPLSRLGELPVVAQFRSGRQAEIEDGLRTIGVSLNAVRRADTWTSIYATVDAGGGFGLVPSLALANLPPRLKVLSLEPGGAERTVVVGWHADRLTAPARDQLIEVSLASAARFCPRIFGEALVAATTVPA
jgi:DNA-binding transcriptional LysR family regulator